ncbi:MAG: TraR/DksA family transcriptional regulator [Chlamydiia bacterium]|nr:TraR/DksA family transcriptional regulator [Chlamydiia bacterium]MCP5509656.1 TraR/DksA family transcriptional regulator [Chlamydiales bacterium]
MKEHDLEKVRKRLLAMRAQITNQVRTATEDVKSVDAVKGYSQHQADEGTDDFNRTISLEVSEKEQGVLRQIDRAIAKIDEGTYGICDVTGNPIPAKRLEAVPYAAMTVEAQEKLEKGLL